MSFNEILCEHHQLAVMAAKQALADQKKYARGAGKKERCVVAVSTRAETSYWAVDIGCSWPMPVLSPSYVLGSFHLAVSSHNPDDWTPLVEVGDHD